MKVVCKTAAAVALALALAIGAGTAASAAASPLSTWYLKYATPFGKTLVKAGTEMTKENPAGCSLLTQAARTAMAAPAPPNNTVFTLHWGMAVAFVFAAGTECTQGVKNNDSAQVESVVPLMTAAETQINDMLKSV